MSARGPAASAIRLWGPVAAWMAAIFLSSSLPVAPDEGIPIPDKVIHGLLFGVLAVLILRSLTGGFPGTATWAHVTWATALALLYGVTDELHQAFVPSRQPDALDLFADAVGASLATVLTKGWLARRGV